MIKKLKASTIDTLVGKPFFYADKETGIGWTSKIDDLRPDMLSDSYTIELSCGTTLKMSRLELSRCKDLYELTNLKD